MTAEVKRESKFDWMLAIWWLAVVCAVIGLADSIYLTWLKLTGELAACGGIGDCESVNASIYSQINGIPIALLGAVAYALILLFLFLESRDDFIGDWSPTLVFGLSLTGTLYSIYLTYIEIAVLKAICPYCVVSAVAILIIFVISIARLRRSNTH
jgi:uncharacterized membrane protein